MTELGEVIPAVLEQTEEQLPGTQNEDDQTALVSNTQGEVLLII